VRAGYQFDETPTTDGFRSTRTPDGDRNWFSAGATYQLNEQVSFDAAATYIDVEEGDIDGARSVTNVVGTTDGSVGILAVGLNYKF
jgi:long-chain fatty acid transport protein